MVKETRIVFGIEDLTVIRVVCFCCGGGVSHSLQQGETRLPEQCPNCDNTWWSSGGRDTAHVTRTRKLLKALRQFAQGLVSDSTSRDAEDHTFSVQFEIDGEEQKDRKG